VSTARFSLKDRVALVTGSTSGIGEALARGLAGAGATVVLNSNNPDDLAAAMQRWRADGLEPHTALFDVTDSAAVAEAVARIEREVGPIAILVNNAGIQRRTPLEDFAQDAWDDLVRVNLDGVFFVAQSVARQMIPRKKGSIINICSINSEHARPAIAPYTATKGGVKMLTRGMAVDWGKHGIRVNGIGPGYFETPLTRHLVADEAFTSWVQGRVPLGRWGQVQDLVGAAVFLASDAASFVTGHVLYVDGGVTAGL
jgi:gluconate 5-dehydrogenase